MLYANTLRSVFIANVQQCTFGQADHPFSVSLQETAGTLNLHQFLSRFQIGHCSHGLMILPMQCEHPKMTCSASHGRQSKHNVLEISTGLSILLEAHQYWLPSLTQLLYLASRSKHRDPFWSNWLARATCSVNNCILVVSHHLVPFKGGGTEGGTAVYKDCCISSQGNEIDGTKLHICRNVPYSTHCTNILYIGERSWRFQHVST